MKHCLSEEINRYHNETEQQRQTAGRENETRCLFALVFLLHRHPEANRSHSDKRNSHQGDPDIGIEIAIDVEKRQNQKYERRQRSHRRQQQKN